MEGIGRHGDSRDPLLERLKFGPNVRNRDKGGGGREGGSGFQISFVPREISDDLCHEGDHFNQ